MAVQARFIKTDFEIDVDYSGTAYGAVVVDGDFDDFPGVGSGLHWGDVDETLTFTGLNRGVLNGAAVVRAGESSMIMTRKTFTAVQEYYVHLEMHPHRYGQPGAEHLTLRQAIRTHPRIAIHEIQSANEVGKKANLAFKIILNAPAPASNTRVYIKQTVEGKSSDFLVTSPDLANGFVDVPAGLTETAVVVTAGDKAGKGKLSFSTIGTSLERHFKVL